MRHGEAERLGGVQVDHQFKLGRLLDRQIGGLRALEDLPGVDADLAMHAGKAGSIADQAACQGGFTPFVDGRNGMVCRQCDELGAAAVEEWIAANDERAGVQLDEGVEGGADLEGSRHGAE